MVLEEKKGGGGTLWGDGGEETEGKNDALIFLMGWIRSERFVLNGTSIRGHFYFACSIVVQTLLLSLHIEKYSSCYGE